MNEIKQEMDKIQEINNKQNSFKKDLLFLLLKIGGADNFLDQKEQGEEKHGIYGTRKRTSSRPI